MIGLYTPIHAHTLGLTFQLELYFSGGFPWADHKRQNPFSGFDPTYPWILSFDLLLYQIESSGLEFHFLSKFAHEISYHHCVSIKYLRTHSYQSIKQLIIQILLLYPT